MLNTNRIDLSRQVFVSADKTSGDLILTALIDEFYVELESQNEAGPAHTSSLVHNPSNDWSRARWPGVSAEARRRGDLVRLVIIAEMMSPNFFREDWESRGYLCQPNSDPIHLGGFCDTLKMFTGVGAQTRDLGNVVRQSLPSSLVDKLEKEFGDQLFFDNQLEIRERFRLAHLTRHPLLSDRLLTDEKALDVMSALTHDFVHEGPHKDYPGLKEHFNPKPSSITVRSVMDSFYTRFCCKEALRLTVSQTDLMVCEFLSEMDFDNAISSEAREQKVDLFGVTVSLSVLSASYVRNAVSVAQAKKEQQDYANDLCVASGWLLCRLFAHAYPNIVSF